MSAPSLPVLNADDLIARAAAGKSGCPRCAAISESGWQSVPGAVDRGALRAIGTLRCPGDEDPTLREHHPGGTNTWSPDAPIAPAFFPYNRCDVWECVGCSRVFLRYTEYGGYYVEERIRPVDPARVIDVPL